MKFFGLSKTFRILLEVNELNIKLETFDPI